VVVVVLGGEGSANDAQRPNTDEEEKGRRFDQWPINRRGEGNSARELLHYASCEPRLDQCHHTFLYVFLRTCRARCAGTNESAHQNKLSHEMPAPDSFQYVVSTFLQHQQDLCGQNHFGTNGDTATTTERCPSLIGRSSGPTIASGLTRRAAIVYAERVAEEQDADLPPATFYERRPPKRVLFGIHGVRIHHDLDRGSSSDRPKLARFERRFFWKTRTGAKCWNESAPTTPTRRPSKPRACLSWLLMNGESVGESTIVLGGAENMCGKSPLPVSRYCGLAKDDGTRRKKAVVVVNVMISQQYWQRLMPLWGCRLSFLHWTVMAGLY
jgi:hypothetical protein